MKHKKAVVIGGTVVAASLAVGMVGYAASVNVSPATAGAKQALVSSCVATSDSVAVTYGTPTDAGGGFTVSQLTVSMPTTDATACAGRTIYIDLSTGSSVIASGSQAVSSGGTVSGNNTQWTITLSTFATGKSMADVADVDIDIQ
ncbi:MAG TPA: hypothetical protein VE990_11555 [Acidimicrobiales bacterium]|nr:hypothetical protein [Acidimicrobiales bacterium]